MFAKIENGKINYLCNQKETEDMIKLTEEQSRILQEGGSYENGEFIEAEKIEEVVDTFVEIKIPVQVLVASPELQQKLVTVSLLFSDIKRMTRNGITTLSNIFIDYIPEFLTKEEYEQLKSLGVEFSEEVDDLFSKKEENEETT